MRCRRAFHYFAFQLSALLHRKNEGPLPVNVIVQKAKFPVTVVLRSTDKPDEEGVPGPIELQAISDIEIGRGDNGFVFFDGCTVDPARALAIIYQGTNVCMT